MKRKLYILCLTIFSENVEIKLPPKITFFNLTKTFDPHISSNIFTFGTGLIHILKIPNSQEILLFNTVVGLLFDKHEFSSTDNTSKANISAICLLPIDFVGGYNFSLSNNLFATIDIHLLKSYRDILKKNDTDKMLVLLRMIPIELNVGIGYKFFSFLWSSFNIKFPLYTTLYHVIAFSKDEYDTRSKAKEAKNEILNKAIFSYTTNPILFLTLCSINFDIAIIRINYFFSIGIKIKICGDIKLNGLDQSKNEKDNNKIDNLYTTTPHISLSMIGIYHSSIPQYVV